MILCIETATSACSVALIHQHAIISIRESFGRNHSEQITLFIDEVMREAGVKFSELDAVAISQGPGSYTGLRIGVSTAKGLCYAADKPMIAIDTLQSMALCAKESIGDQLHDDDLLCPMIDARRMEVYASLFDTQLQKKQDTKAIVLNENSFDDFTVDHKVFLFGDGAEKCKVLYQHNDKIIIIDNINASARGMGILSELSFDRKQFVDVAYFEPFYLKDFVAGVPKVKGLI